MVNKSKGFAWILPIIIVALVGLVGGGAYMMGTKTSNTNNTTGNIFDDSSMPSNDADNGSNGTKSTTTTTEARIEFPWDKYSTTLNIRASSKNDKLIGQTANIGGYGDDSLVISETANIGGGSNVDTAYIFKKLTIAASSNIGTLYVESGTTLEIGLNTKIGKKVVLSHNDLVRQAEQAAGITSKSTTSTTTTSTSTSTKTTTTTNTGTTSSTTTASVADYAGEWDGTFASSPQVSASCKASGKVSLSISSAGIVTGYAVVNGVQAPGTGKVDSKGNISGSWNYTGLNLNYSGKLNSTSKSGSGSYQNSIGCFGSFSVAK